MRLRQTFLQKYVVWTVFFFLSSISLFTGSSLFANSTVKVGIHDVEPLVFMDDNGNPGGFIIEVLQHIAEKENWDLTYFHGSWNQCLDRLLLGEIDLLFPAFFSEDRSQFYNFNKEAIFSTWGRIFSNRYVEINSILDLENKKISSPSH